MNRLQLQAGAGQHLELHGGQAGCSQTWREENKPGMEEGSPPPSQLLHFLNTHISSAAPESAPSTQRAHSLMKSGSCSSEFRAKRR